MLTMFPMCGQMFPSFKFFNGKHSFAGVVQKNGRNVFTAELFGASENNTYFCMV